MTRAEDEVCDHGVSRHQECERCDCGHGYPEDEHCWACDDVPGGEA